MNPEDLKLPKLDRGSFQLSDAVSRSVLGYPYSIVAHADPAWILSVLEPGDVREVVAAYARFQAASAQAAAELYNTVGKIAQGGGQTGD